MTTDLPRPVDPSGAPDHQPGGDRPGPRRTPRQGRRGGGRDRRQPRSAAPAADNEPVPDATLAADQDSSSTRGQTSDSQDRDPAADGTANELALRHDTAPTDPLDFADRHDTRATRDDQTLRRYIELEEHRTRREWQRLAMSLVALAVGMVLYLAGVVVLVQLIPGITPRQAAAIVGSALLAGSGGLAVTHLVQRRRRRSIGPADPPP